ncbi:MAG: BtrH N-terminal domain-containing protein [Aliarcobacter sp.]
MHCESGVVSTFVSHYGLKVSEPMAFGMTSTLSLFFFLLLN